LDSFGEFLEGVEEGDEGPYTEGGEGEGVGLWEEEEEDRGEGEKGNGEGGYCDFLDDG